MASLGNSATSPKQASGLSKYWEGQRMVDMRGYEREKRVLQQKQLTAEKYQIEIQKLSKKYGV